MKFSKLAEQQIRKAQMEGQFDDLKGTGKPLPSGGDGDFAEGAGFRIMAEAGALPREIELRKAIEEQLLKFQATSNPDDQKREMATLADLQMHLSIQEEARRKFNRNQ